MITVIFTPLSLKVHLHIWAQTHTHTCHTWGTCKPELEVWIIFFIARFHVEALVPGSGLGSVNMFCCLVLLQLQRSKRETFMIFVFFCTISTRHIWIGFRGDLIVRCVVDDNGHLDFFMQRCFKFDWFCKTGTSCRRAVRGSRITVSFESWESNCSAFLYDL